MANPISSRFDFTWRHAHTAVRFLSREGLILLLYIGVSAAVLNIFMQTRGLEEGSPRFGLAHMLDGSAELPFVKRQLLPQVANLLTELVPPSEREAFVRYHLDKYQLKQTYFKRARLSNSGHETWTADYALKYHLIYALMFASLLCTLYLLRATGQVMLPSSNPLSPFLPIGFALLLPLTFMHGGFFYDFSELFFFAALMLAAAKAKYQAWLLLLPLAVFNKETAILAPILFAPILFLNCRNISQRIIVILSIALAASLFWLIRQEFSANPGGDTLWELPHNLIFLSQPSNYFLWADLYAPLIPVPRGFSLLFIGALIVLISPIWRDLPKVLKQLFWVALIVDLPLLILFGYRDEIRNLSMLFIPIYLAVAYALLNTTNRAFSHDPQAPSAA